MKKYELTIEWEIHDTRNEDKGFRTGTSKIMVETNDLSEVMQHAIDFARNVPSWEFERNGINLEEYREYPRCTYYYRTELSKVDIKVVK